MPNLINEFATHSRNGAVHMASSEVGRFSFRRQIQQALISDFELGTASSDSLVRQLRALQLSGMSDADIRVFIEVERQSHSDGPDADLFDDAAVAALYLITGLCAGMELNDAARCTAALQGYLPREACRAAIDRAFEASDLLPVNRSAVIEDRQKDELASELASRIVDDSYRPSPAHFTRAPKRRFVTRPAASLRLQDRVVYQALADQVEELLVSKLPETVLWPRPNVSSRDANTRFRSISDEWDSAYEVNADIESYFEYVDHSLLAHILATYLGLPAHNATAVETLLNVVMESSRGLPQGPVASDIFATAYLLPLDVVLQDRGWNYVRYQDDIKVSATDVADARNTMRELESAVREFGLRLAQDKTYYVSLLKRVRVAAPYSTDAAQTRAEAARETQSPIGANDLVEEFSSLAHQVFGKSPGTSVTAAASKLGEILTKLAAGTGAGLSRRDLRTALDWFPQLAPEAAQYLAQRYSERPDDVAEFLRFRLSQRREQDWENAWIVLAPDLSGAQLDASLGGMLVEAARDQALPPLTRCNALKVLVRHGIITDTADPEWTRGVPKPLLSELALETHTNSGGALGLPELEN